MPSVYRVFVPAAHLASRLAARLVPIGSTALDLILPPACASCGAVGSVLCGRCAAQLRPALGLRCLRCWLPSEGICRACLQGPPSLRQLRSGFVYDGPARSLVLALKYHGAVAAADALVARAPARAVRSDVDLIVPIPMTAWRRRARGGNHAERLARAVARQYGLPLAARLLARRGWRAKQQARSANWIERRANMRGAFRVCEPVNGRTILLIDDVATTLATLESAAAALLAAGAAAVDGWTATREQLRD